MYNHLFFAFLLNIFSIIVLYDYIFSYRSSDFEAKFIQERITTVERNIAEFCNAFSLYSRKAARLRDKGDEIAKISLSYSESEDINKSLSECLANFASSMSTISDYGNIRVLNIDNKVVNELTRYENICKQTKNEVKQIFSVREKEMAKRRQLDRVRERNASRQHIVIIISML